ncbi:unnamed protein product [Adineta ricciae]|uniref:Nephrocystin 3-like N-terminal domain-containing protein n=2 Tax=Adineta ricciae TaxID=249248 RepID=A0A815CRF3_ADIRI|nr:unnamed protein product [Adineta ricciae]
MVDAIQKLKKDIAANNVLVFVGSDVSVYTANGDENVCFWKGLLQQGLRQCYLLNEIDDANFQDIMSNLDANITKLNDYFSIADQIKHWLSKHPNAYEEWLISTLGELHPQKPNMIKAIAGLNCPVLTTNYDSLLGDLLNKGTLTWSRYQYEDPSIDIKDYILHVHGNFQHTDTVVFNSDDYNELHENNFAEVKLKTLTRGKVLLFIGYGTGILDPSFCKLLQWISDVTAPRCPTIYKLVRSNIKYSVLENIIEIPYGNSFDDLILFTKSLSSFSTFQRKNLPFATRQELVRQKYLNYLIQEYGHVSIFGSANNDISLPLESVYVELKFDPTHPSIKAMKALDMNEEFKRKVLSNGFFTSNEKSKLIQAIIQRHSFNPEAVYRDLMVDQWLHVLLSNREIFSLDEASAIMRKISHLKREILGNNNFTETKQYQIQQAYNEFKHFIVLGHPGSGKTTISKWLVINMAQQCLGKTNKLFNKNDHSMKEKIPILIPIWKYVDQIKDNSKQQKRSLLQFLQENSTMNSLLFTEEEREDLSLLMTEYILHGNVLIIFEGLDEVPIHVDRTDLMKEINMLLERSIDYDVKSGKLIYSLHEQKEINNTKDPTIGNRVIITSRIEGNYFEEINFYIPRLTIQDMSNEALKMFCSSYTKCIRGEAIDESLASQLYTDITENKDIFQLAINPQLASVIAAVYNQYDDKLPEKRIDLYDKAIEKMIERLVTSSLHQDLRLTVTMLWTILQDIAEYLHSRVDGLSESNLRDIIQKQKVFSDAEDSTSKLVDIFKYKVGLLNEFGYNSFRFIHRTFQEYLAAKNIVYSNGIQRSEGVIYQTIRNKIDVPNWRVPLYMTFGILSKYHRENGLFDRILTRLLAHEQTSSVSTLIVPFVIIDSLSDIYFPSTCSQRQMIRILADMLLSDYKDLSGFSRLKEHQELIHFYFSKLNKISIITMIGWFNEKLQDKQHLAPCANIIYQLKWYCPKFHETFLQNLPYDSQVWNWPIDALLRYYSTEVKDSAVTSQLKVKHKFLTNVDLLNFVKADSEWLCLIIALYGGHKNHNVASTIAELNQLCLFLCLSDSERAPFLFYFQNIWGVEDPAYNMAVHADKIENGNHWNDLPIISTDDIYKESFHTTKICELLAKQRSKSDLVNEFRRQINTQQCCLGSKIEAFLVLIVLEDFDFVKVTIKNEDDVFIKHFVGRLEQTISALKDPIARSSSHMIPHLLNTYNHVKTNTRDCDLKFADYCTIHLSSVANSGGLPLDTSALADAVEDLNDKYALYAEYFAFKLTDSFRGQMEHDVKECLDTCMKSMHSDVLIQSFLKINDAVQIYKPLRAYSWPMDRFPFRLIQTDDIPIAFFNCLENIHPNLTIALETICDIFIRDGYFVRNPELIPSIILLVFGVISKDLNITNIYAKLLGDVTDEVNIKEFLMARISSMSNPYYKARALYQFAQYDDERNLKLLTEAFDQAKIIPDASLRFQVLEKIYAVLQVKQTNQNAFTQTIIREMISTWNQIEHLHDRTIASIRLAFYGLRDFRKKYLTHALEALSHMDENTDKIRLLVKLKPLMSVYTDLQDTLNLIINNLQNETYRNFVHGLYGKILCTQKYKDLSTNNQLECLFRLFTNLNDAKMMIGEDQSLTRLWINLYRDVDNQSHLEKLLKIGLVDELFLTPQVAVIIDELIQQGREDAISVLYPYIIKPSNEVLPIVQRWFTDYHDKKINKLAALLLAESKCIFELAIHTIVDLFKIDNDQMRYRAQRVFQHPERDPTIPSKKISVLGERTVLKILQTASMEHLPRVTIYLRSFFSDVLWDDPEIFENMQKSVAKLKEEKPVRSGRMWFFHRIKFINQQTWNALINSAQLSTDASYIEELLHSVMNLTINGKIRQDQWQQFAVVLATVDTTRFSEKVYLTRRELHIIDFILEEVCVSADLNDEFYFMNLESKLIDQCTTQVENFHRTTYDRMQDISFCNFRVSVMELNKEILQRIENTPITLTILENLIQWLIQKLLMFNESDDSIYSLMIIDNLLSLVAACVQKEDYFYRKITNNQNFDKFQMIKLLVKTIHYHPYFPARGSAFILLAAIDLPDHRIIIDVLSALFDENLVKEYTTIGMPLIHLSSNEFVDDLLKSLTNESAIKVYETLKIITQFVLDEKLDAHTKSKIVQYLAHEIGEFKSKKVVSYYYTDVSIPFTTTLENELYKTWTKIQGLSGKTQYAITTNQ